MPRLALFLCVCLLTSVGRAQDANIVELSTHVGTGVRSAWLANGVRVHHKKIGEASEDVVVTIRLLGGAISESDNNRGITQAAMIAWERPRTRSTDTLLFAKRMTGFQCEYEGGFVDDDLVGMTLTVPARRLGPAMRLAAELLDEPFVDPDAFDAWRGQQRVRVLQRAGDADGQLLEVVSGALYPADARVRPLTTDDLDSLEHADVAAWLDRLVRTSPVEVGIAGPVSAERALEIVGMALGDLPARQRITPRALSRRRDVGPRPTGPISVEQVCASCDSSVALLGLFAPDRQEVDDVRAVFAALILLEGRLGRIRWETPAPKVEMLLEGTAYPGYGRLYARVEAPRGRLLEVVSRVESEVDRFALMGPTDYEMRAFHASAEQEIALLLANPAFWSNRMAVNTSSGVGFDELDTLMDTYITIKAEDIRATFADYARPDNRFTLVVLEDAAPADATPEPRRPR